MSDVRDVIIIGSGPAGLTAAIYTARANLAPLVLEGEPSSTSDQPGGQLMLTTDVENFPGFPEGVMGPELMMNFRMQAERFGAEIQTMKASHVDLSSAPYGVWVGDPDAADPTYRAHSLIIATGAQSIMLDLDRETELIGTYTYGSETTNDGRRTSSFELAFELAGKVPFDKMLSATYPLARYVDAIAHAAESGTRGGVKVAFDMRDEKRRGTGDT